MFYFKKIKVLFFLLINSISSISEIQIFLRYIKTNAYSFYICDFLKRYSKVFFLEIEESYKNLNIFCIKRKSITRPLVLQVIFSAINFYNLIELRIYKSARLNNLVKSFGNNFYDIKPRREMNSFGLYFGFFVNHNIPAWYMHVYNFCRFVPRMHVLRTDVNFFSIRFFYRLSLAGIP